MSDSVSLWFCCLFVFSSWMPRRVPWLSWHKHVRKSENRTRFLPPVHWMTWKTLDVWRSATSAFIPNQQRRKILNLQLMLRVFWGHRAPPADHLLYVLQFRMKMRWWRKTEMAKKVHVKPLRRSEMEIQTLTPKGDMNLKETSHAPRLQRCFPFLLDLDCVFHHFLCFLFHHFWEAVWVSLSQFWTINQRPPLFPQFHVQTRTASAIAALRLWNQRSLFCILLTHCLLPPCLHLRCFHKRWCILMSSSHGFLTAFQLILLLSPVFLPQWVLMHTQCRLSGTHITHSDSALGIIRTSEALSQHLQIHIILYMDFMDKGSIWHLKGERYRFCVEPDNRRCSLIVFTGS